MKLTTGMKKSDCTDLLGEKRNWINPSTGIHFICI